MKPKHLLCLALALSAVLCCGARVRADDSTITASPSVQSGGHVYHDVKHGFQLTLPQGWEAGETNLPVAHYDCVFLTINNQRPGLVYEGWEGTWIYNNRATEPQSNEVYISVGYAGGPMGVSMAADTAGDDLKPFLATNQMRVFSSKGLLYLGVSFFKRGQHWSISACLKEPVTDENRQRVMTLMQSFRFVKAPVENASWAESLAWNELPEQVRGTEDWLQGWPVVSLYADESGSSSRGRRSVSVTNLGSTYSVTFDLRAMGEWPFLVKTNGEVEAGPPILHAKGPSPSQWPSDLPGASRGIIDSYWVAPYVQATVVSGQTTLVWFSRDGSMERQAAVSDIQPGFVDIRDEPRMIRGINEDWQITLPRGPSDMSLAGYITSTPDSRVFVHERHPRHGSIALDIYIHGKCINTIGPFIQCLGDDAALNEDGSAGMLIWKDQSKKEAQIVTSDTNGNIRLRVDCGSRVTSLIVAPDGRGALLHPNGGTNYNTFMWFTSAGLQHSLEIGPNPEFLGWVPKTCRSLFSTSIGDLPGPYKLIDWSTGKTIWEIPSPGDGQPLGIALTPKLILFSFAEPYPPDTGHNRNELLLQSGHEWVRTFYAVDVQDGKPVARWRAQFPHRYEEGIRDHFLQLKDKLYYVTADEFTELNLNDTLAKAHGWQ